MKRRIIHTQQLTYNPIPENTLSTYREEGLVYKGVQYSVYCEGGHNANYFITDTLGWTCFTSPRFKLKLSEALAIVKAIDFLTEDEIKAFHNIYDIPKRNPLQEVGKKLRKRNFHNHIQDSKLFNSALLHVESVLKAEGKLNAFHLSNGKN